MIAGRPSPSEEAGAAVAERSRSLILHGIGLAKRGAYYSARAEIIKAIRLVAQALDAEGNTDSRSKSLAAAFRALDEAEDFVPRGSKMEADLDMQHLLAAHRTEILKGVPRVTPLVAIQRYHAYAQDQLAEACGAEPVASLALYALGRLQTVMAERSTGLKKMHGPLAMTFYQSALMVDASNHMAANELGVLLAKYGQLAAAKAVLVHSVATRPEAGDLAELGRDPFTDG